MNNKYLSSACAIVLTIFISISELYGQQDVIRSAEAKVGILSPLSGPFASIGVDVRQGTEIALDEIKEPLQFSFVYADARAESAQAVTEFNRLLNLEHIIAAVPIRGPVGMAINPISLIRKIPILGAVANKKFTLENPYAFQLWADSEAEADYLVTTFQKLKAESIAVITAIDDYPMAVSEAVVRIAKQKNIKVVRSLEVTPTETDFRTTAMSLAKTNPDVIFSNVSIAQIAPLIKQLRQMSIKSQIVNNFWISKAEVLAALGQQATDIYYFEMATDYPGLKQAVKEKYNGSISAMTVSAYVSAHMLNQAFQSLSGQQINSESLQDALVKISEIKTSNGSFKVKDRQVAFPLTLMQLKNGAIEKAELPN